MIVKLLQNPRVVYQKADDESNLPEPAIAIGTDATPIVVMSQEGREITVNLATLPELWKCLRQVAAAAREG